MLRSSLRKPCTCCGKTGHTAFTCRPRKPLQTKRPMQRGKRLKKLGRIGQKLIDQRTEYFEENDPPYYCIYCLVIGIDIPILKENAQVEHGKTKNNHPEFRFTKSNLYISCSFHNEDKGGTDIDEYIEKLRGQYVDQKDYDSQV